MWSVEESIRFLGRHFVNLCWIDETLGTEFGNANDGHGKPATASGFVISIDDHWLFVTAGHILKGIEDARHQGQKLTNFMLNDTWGQNPKHPSMPFDFNGALKHFVDDEAKGLDYGVILLRENPRALLMENGVVPIDEMGWKVGIPDSFDTYFLLGTPDELNKVDTVGGLHVMRTCVMFPVERLKEPPNGCATTFPRIYCQIAPKLVAHDDQTPLRDINGMSGCPLIGIKRGDDGNRRYWVVGVQSSWFPNSRIACICPLKRLAEWIEAGMSEANDRK